MNTANIGEKIKTLRNFNRMTQTEFGALLGVEAVHISNVERGKKRLSFDKLEILSKKFSISMDDLMSDDDEETKSKAELLGEIVLTLGELEVSQLRIVNRMITTLKRQQKSGHEETEPPQKATFELNIQN